MEDIINNVNNRTANMALPEMTATLINALVGDELTRVRTERDIAQNNNLYQR